jgi:hypothetical protein
MQKENRKNRPCFGKYKNNHCHHSTRWVQYACDEGWSRDESEPKANLKHQVNSDMAQEKQQVLVFQQNGSGEKKIEGIRRYAGDAIDMEVVSIDEMLPPVLDDTEGMLPDRIEADMVLDFLKHPDLSHDLARRCQEQDVPMVASGKKMKMDGVSAPPT